MVARETGIPDKSNILWEGGSRSLDQSLKERVTIAIIQNKVENVPNILIKTVYKLLLLLSVIILIDILNKILHIRLFTLYSQPLLMFLQK